MILKALQLGLLALLAAQASAAEPVNPAKDWSIYGGFGFNRDLLHFNVESPTPYANVYLRAGQFIKGDHVAAQLGFRKAYSYTSTDQTGYYVGGYIGHVRSSRDAGDRFNVLGAGPELSYVWQNSGRLNAFSVSVAITEQKKLSDGGKISAEPYFGIGYTIQAPLWKPKGQAK